MPALVNMLRQVTSRGGTVPYNGGSLRRLLFQHNACVDLCGGVSCDSCWDFFSTLWKVFGWRWGTSGCSNVLHAHKHSQLEAFWLAQGSIEQYAADRIYSSVFKESHTKSNPCATRHTGPSASSCWLPNRDRMSYSACQIGQTVHNRQQQGRTARTARFKHASGWCGGTGGCTARKVHGNRIKLVLLGTQNRTFGPYLAAIHWLTRWNRCK
jgi:hypothetical protein